MVAYLLFSIDELRCIDHVRVALFCIMNVGGQGLERHRHDCLLSSFLMRINNHISNKSIFSVDELLSKAVALKVPFHVSCQRREAMI